MWSFKQLSLISITFQFLALLFFEVAFERFYYFLHADIYSCLLGKSFEESRRCLLEYGGLEMKIGELISGPIHFLMYGLLFGFLLVLSLNFLLRRQLLSSMVVASVYLLCFFLGGLKFLIPAVLWLINFLYIKGSGLEAIFLLRAFLAFVIGVCFIYFSFYRRKLSKDLIDVS